MVPFRFKFRRRAWQQRKEPKQAPRMNIRIVTKISISLFYHFIHDNALVFLAEKIYTYSKLKEKNDEKIG